MAKKEKQQTIGKKLTVSEIISYCKDELGITFNLKSKEEASVFLAKHNYFFRLKQYAEFGEKTKAGKYTNVDFGHLVELSTIDMFFRKLILKMTIDFEHCLKVKIINDCQENPKDDGYFVVQKFLEKNNRLRTSIENYSTTSNFYNRQIFDNYKESPSVWSVVELLAFSDFIDFYAHYYEFFNLKCEYTPHFDSVRRLRNAAAHNACMLSNFKSQNWFHPDIEMNFELLGANLGIGNGIISTCMKVPVLNDFVVMLSNYTKLVSSPKVKEKTFEEMISFFDGRMILHKDYFDGISEIKNAYIFARSVLEFYSKK